MAFMLTRDSETPKPIEVWVVQKIDLPDGTSIQVCSVPFDRWLNDTDVSRPINRQRITGKEAIGYMNTLREEMIQVANQMEPRTEVHHKGFTLYKIGEKL